MPVTTRFAPSPSGHLHVGGARTALFSWAFARQHGGSFVLRIEDTDQKRSSDAASVGFLKDLHWLGIKWNEGPAFEHCGGGSHGPYFQSQRLAIYDEHLARLVAEGKAYYAFDTPEELDARRKAASAAGTAYRYDRAAMALPAATVRAWLDEGRPAVIRLRVPEGPVTIRDEVLGEATIPAGEIDDFVLRKADGYPTYHFAVVVDDQLMGITHVIRAQEHFNNTAKHLLIQDALGFPHPVYAHLGLIMNPDGSKMSKRDKDKALRAVIAERGLKAAPEGTIDRDVFDAWIADRASQLSLEDGMRLADALDVVLPEINVDDFRRSGYLPSVMTNFLALNGWSPGNDLEKFDLEFIVKNFSFARVMKGPARFDRVKLLAFNQDAIQSMSCAEFTRQLADHGLSWHPEFMHHLGATRFAVFAGAVHGRSRTLDEPFRSNRYLVEPDSAIVYQKSKATLKAMGGDAAGAAGGAAHLAALEPVLAAIDDAMWSPAVIEDAVGAYVAAAAPGQIGKVAQPLRVAITGTTVSPPIFETLAVLGREATLVRMKRCLAEQWGS